MDASELLTELVDAGACRQGIEELEEHLEEERLGLHQASEVWSSLDNTFMSSMRWLLMQTGLAGNVQYYNLPDTAESIRAAWPWERIEPALRARAASGREEYKRADAFVCFIQDEVKLPRFDPMDLDHPYCMADVWDQLDAGDHFRVLFHLGESRLGFSLKETLEEILREDFNPASDDLAECRAHIAKMDSVGWAGQPDEEFCKFLSRSELYLADEYNRNKVWNDEYERRQASGLVSQGGNNNRAPAHPPNAD